MVDDENQMNALSWRLYKDETDKDQICDMCKNVYNGKDFTPHVVSLLAKDDCSLPLVAAWGQEVVAFCNLKLFKSDDDTTDVIYIEKVRVSEAMRRKGVGTALVKEAMKAGESWCDSGRCTRFLSTTTPENFAMSKIFKATGWVCRGAVEMWPSSSTLDTALQTTPNIRGRYLDVLQLSTYIPHHALALVSSWQKLETPSQVWNAMRRIHAHGGCLMKPGYYAVETIKQAAELATARQNDGRSVWKLERGHSPPVLLFVQKANADPSEPLIGDSLSACVIDVAGAEACVAFAASRKDLDAFSISFDPAITKNKMRSSVLLSQVDTNMFLIYESSR